jgi:hypothetical protein
MKRGEERSELPMVEGALDVSHLFVRAAEELSAVARIRKFFIRLSEYIVKRFALFMSLSVVGVFRTVANGAIPLPIDGN